MSSSQQKTTSVDDAPPALLALPAEMKLQILSHLPGRQIQACRRVCREFTELINSRENQKAIIDPIRARAAKRRWPLLNVITSPYKKSLFTSLFTWISCRGIWPDIERNRWIIRSAARQWSIRISDEIKAMLHTMFRTNTAYPVVLRCADRLLEIIAEALVQAYIDVHFPDLFVGTENTATRMCDVSTKRKFFSVIDSRIQQVDIQYLATHLGLPLSRAQLGRWYDRIIARRAPVAYKNSTALLNIPRGPSPQLTVPQLLLTGFSYWYQEHDFATSIGDPRPVAVETHGRCTAKDLRELLGCRIPVVEPYAAWYVRWQWAYDLVCEAIGGKALTEIQKAALLEELHVF